MTNLYLYLAPLWLLKYTASLLVIVLTLMALRESRVPGGPGSGKCPVAVSQLAGPGLCHLRL